MKKIIITVSESHLGNLNSLVGEFEQEGLTISKLYEFGVIAGEAEDEVINKLLGHNEIVSITEDRQASIAPPDSDIQ